MPRRRVSPGRAREGGLVAVTTRPAIRARLRQVCSALDLPPPHFASAVEEALGPAGNAPVLLLDLGSCCADLTVTPIMRAWECFCPGSELVILAPLLDRERELRTAVALVGELQHVRARVMTTSDFYRDEVWRNLREGGDRAALEAELREELMAAVRATGRPLRGEPLVLELLHEARRQGEARMAGATSPTHVGSDGADRARKHRWRLLRRAGQLPATWLLLVFRVLWYAKLREQGWRASEVAAFLGFASPRDLRLTVRRRLGVGVRTLKCIRREQALRWAAELLTTPHVTPARATPRALIGPLLESR